MNIVINFDNIYGGNIVEFISYFKQISTQITNNEIDNDKLHFVSIHGSKGLEASTVILIDFKLSADKSKTKFIWSEPDDIFEHNSKPLFFIKPSQNNSFAEAEQFINAEYIEEEKELWRLLYVALTRARDNLYWFKV